MRGEDAVYKAAERVDALLLAIVDGDSRAAAFDETGPKGVVVPERRDRVDQCRRVVRRDEHRVDTVAQNFRHRTHPSRDDWTMGRQGEPSDFKYIRPVVTAQATKLFSTISKRNRGERP